MEKARKPKAEIATIDCALITIEVQGDEFPLGFDTVNQIQVEPQIETQDAVAEGFEDAMPQALKDMQKCLDAGMGMLAANDVELDYNFAPIGRGGRQQFDDGGGSWDTGMAGGSGGNTYNFYSPEPITESVARREFEQLQRNLAFGF